MGAVVEDEWKVRTTWIGRRVVAKDGGEGNTGSFQLPRREQGTRLAHVSKQRAQSYFSQKHYGHRKKLEKRDTSLPTWEQDSSVHNIYHHVHSQKFNSHITIASGVSLRIRLYQLSSSSSTQWRNLATLYRSGRICDFPQLSQQRPFR